MSSSSHCCCHADIRLAPASLILFRLPRSIIKAASPSLRLAPFERGFLAMPYPSPPSLFAKAECLLDVTALCAVPSPGGGLLAGVGPQVIWYSASSGGSDRPALAALRDALGPDAPGDRVHGLYSTPLCADIFGLVAASLDRDRAAGRGEAALVAVRGGRRAAVIAAVAPAGCSSSSSQPPPPRGVGSSCLLLPLAVLPVRIGRPRFFCFRRAGRWDRRRG